MKSESSTAKIPKPVAANNVRLSHEMNRILGEMATFRYALRKFLRFSELAARECGVTPQQHQLLLGVQGYTGRGSATVGELAEFLQERHHSVVGLIERAEQKGLVVRAQDAKDRRVVNVSLTPAGRKIVIEVAHKNYSEAKRLGSLWQSCELPAAPAAKSRKIINLSS